MDISLADGIGAIAGTLTTLAFLPQVIKTWRTKSAGDISLVMLVAFTAGVALWLLYGLVIWAFPVIFFNLLTLGLTGILLHFKLKEKGRPEGRP